MWYLSHHFSKLYSTTSILWFEFKYYDYELIFFNIFLKLIIASSLKMQWCPIHLQHRLMLLKTFFKMNAISLFSGLRPFHTFLVYHISIDNVVPGATGIWLCCHCLQLIYKARPSSGLHGPQWCGIGQPDNLFGVRPSTAEHGLYTLKSTPAGNLWLHHWP